MQNSWFIRPAPKVKPKLRLICFAYAGGNASLFYDWHQYLPYEVELLLIQLPGRANRIMEPALDSMCQIMQALLSFANELTATPYILFGHSLGSRIAFELAYQLQKLGKKEPQHLIASASRAAHLKREAQPSYLLPDDEFIRELQGLNGTPDVILNNNELLQLLLPLLRADFKVAECYQSLPEKIACDFTVLIGTQDVDVGYEDALAWQELTSKNTSITEIQGDHFFIHHNVQAVIDAVVTVIKSELVNLKVDNTGQVNV